MVIVNIHNPSSHRKVVLCLPKHISPKSSNILHESQYQGVLFAYLARVQVLRGCAPGTRASICPHQTSSDQMDQLQEVQTQQSCLHGLSGTQGNPSNEQKEITSLMVPLKLNKHRSILITRSPWYVQQATRKQHQPRTGYLCTLLGDALSQT